MRILITEDNDDVRETLKDYFEYEGFDVVGAKNGSEGGRILQTQSIDLVITDIVMPVKDGLEMIRDARKNHPDLKVIAISGGGLIDSEEYLKTARLLGAIKTFSKPINMRELIKVVQQVAAE